MLRSIGEWRTASPAFRAFWRRLALHDIRRFRRDYLQPERAAFDAAVRRQQAPEGGMSYDPQCELLAEYFLRHLDLGADYHGILRALAQQLQNTAEAVLHDLEHGVENSA